LQVRRREFIAGLGCAAATYPLGALAQQRRAMPVIGYIGLFPDGLSGSQSAFLKGLREMGYIDGQNVSIAYRSAFRRTSPELWDANPSQ
jgi:putative ABC transport system substrate-binding protein